tara:strand:+ start:491 stop:1000 length:510 start_codon:yes stop_codon:yes gene_type:complete
MNIFYLHPDPIVCAKMHNDKHVVKMILEYAQMLSSAHRTYSPEGWADEAGLPKIGRHYNHPQTKWVRANKSNYLWLYSLFRALLNEYYYRYGYKQNRRHHHEVYLLDLTDPPKNIPHGEWFEPPQCMPDIFKDDCVITAYRKYYQYAKASFNKWTRRMEPDWLSEKIPL